MGRNGVREGTGRPLGWPRAWGEIGGVRVPMGVGRHGGYRGAHGCGERGGYWGACRHGERLGVLGCLWVWGEIGGVGVPTGMGRDWGCRGAHGCGETRGVPGCSWVWGGGGVLGCLWAWGDIRGFGEPTGVGRDGGHPGSPRVQGNGGYWGVLGFPRAGGGGVSGFPWIRGPGGPGVPVFEGDRSGGCPRPRSARGAAPTLDGEGGPVLCLPARGAGPARVHPLRPPRHLRNPAGTQTGCGTPRWGRRGRRGGFPTAPSPSSLPQHPVPHAVGGGQLPAVLQPLQTRPRVP